MPPPQLRSGIAIAATASSAGSRGRPRKSQKETETGTGPAAQTIHDLGPLMRCVALQPAWPLTNCGLVHGACSQHTHGRMPHTAATGAFGRRLPSGCPGRWVAQRAMRHGCEPGFSTNRRRMLRHSGQRQKCLTAIDHDQFCDTFVQGGFSGGPSVRQGQRQIGLAFCLHITSDMLYHPHT